MSFGAWWRAVAAPSPQLLSAISISWICTRFLQSQASTGVPSVHCYNLLSRHTQSSESGTWVVYLYTSGEYIALIKASDETQHTCDISDQVFDTL